MRSRISFTDRGAARLYCWTMRSASDLPSRALPSSTMFTPVMSESHCSSSWILVWSLVMFSGVFTDSMRARMAADWGSSWKAAAVENCTPARRPSRMFQVLGNATSSVCGMIWRWSSSNAVFHSSRRDFLTVSSYWALRARRAMERRCAASLFVGSMERISSARLAAVW